MNTTTLMCFALSYPKEIEENHPYCNATENMDLEFPLALTGSDIDFDEWLQEILTAPAMVYLMPVTFLVMFLGCFYLMYRFPIADDAEEKAGCSCDIRFNWYLVLTFITIIGLCYLLLRHMMLRAPPECIDQFVNIWMSSKSVSPLIYY